MLIKSSLNVIFFLVLASIGVDENFNFDALKIVPGFVELSLDLGVQLILDQTQVISLHATLLFPS